MQRSRLRGSNEKTPACRDFFFVLALCFDMLFGINRTEKTFPSVRINRPHSVTPTKVPPLPREPSKVLCLHCIAQNFTVSRLLWRDFRRQHLEFARPVTRIAVRNVRRSHIDRCTIVGEQYNIDRSTTVVIREWVRSCRHESGFVIEFLRSPIRMIHRELTPSCIPQELLGSNRTVSFDKT